MIYYWCRCVGSMLLHIVFLLDMLSYVLEAYMVFEYYITHYVDGFDDKKPSVIIDHAIETGNF